VGVAVFIQWPLRDDVVQVTGWAVFGVGVWIHVYRETFLYAVLLRDNPTQPVLVLDDIALILIIIGGIIVTISFLGCWGACTESVCFLAFVSTFSSLLFVFLSHISPGLIFSC